MVAKSYQNMKTVCDPYEKSGRMYIDVINSKGTIKQVRWYSESEYNKMYPKDTKEMSRSQKNILGFDKGYITIFRGIKEEHEEWFKQSICRFARWWGWYVPSTKEVPADLPSGVMPVRLNWDGMGNEEERLQKEPVVKAHVTKTLRESATAIKTSNSKYQGKVGDRLEIKINVIQKIETENKYGKVFEYILTDEKGNYYKWKTSAKDWGVYTSHKIRGTVKEYGEFEGEELTILTRCLEG